MKEMVFHILIHLLSQNKIYVFSHIDIIENNLIFLWKYF